MTTSLVAMIGHELDEDFDAGQTRALRTLTRELAGSGTQLDECEGVQRDENIAEIVAATIAAGAM